VNIDFWRIVNALTLIKAKHPDLRVGQILVNVADANAAAVLFFAEDGALADALEAYLRSDDGGGE
jgi:hypothetical protein